jgi:TolB-like protein
MASVIPTFEYDIFISYRHNDNRTGWVTEFVNALQAELAATIKEPLSIYFDKNPNDGLLETHIVDRSLEGKLRCLIFIPIISQTYCDSKSFAWRNEFCAFNRLTMNDQFGREVKLSNGNVASRILPIKIHDLEEEDKIIIESEVNGVLRSIEFIYKEPGVNRPLKSSDIRSENQNKIEYRNQINKVANALKEIIQAIRKPTLYRQIAPSQSTNSENRKRSIIVLPFVNISNDPEQEYFSDGLTDEIIHDLAQIKDVLVISRSSAMTFKGTNKKIAEIANETNVQYVLEGSVRKAGKEVRITVQLINAQDDSHIWADRYNGTLDDIFDMQEKVSRSILKALQLKLNKEESNKMAKRPIDNAQAYELYLKAQYEFYRFKEPALIRAIQYLESALEIVGKNTFIYGSLGFTYANLYNISSTAEVAYLEKARALVKNIFDLQPDAPEGHSLLGFITAFTGSKKEMLRHLKTAYQYNPNDSTTLVMLGLACFYCGQAEYAEKVIKELREIDPFNPISPIIMSMISCMRGDLRVALELSKEGYEMNPEVPQAQLYYAYFLFCNDHREISYSIFDRLITEGAGTIFEPMGKFLKFAFQGKKSLALDSLSDDFKRKLKLDCEWSWLIADGFAFIGEKEEALNWLESIVSSDFINYPLLNQHDPYLINVRGEERFKAIIKRAKIAWEELNSIGYDT